MSTMSVNISNTFIQCHINILKDLSCLSRIYGGGGGMHGALPTMISLHIEKTTIYEVGYSVPRLRQSQNVAGLKRGLGSQPILVIQINYICTF
jgi:hypothetical protein